jgi:multicomponent Na+:H+ antiporter subunit B
MLRPFESLMLRHLLVPLVASLQLFAVYVVMHGHYSPGGGFQGGVLLACAWILPRLVHGDPPEAPDRGAARGMAVSAIGVLIFAGIGALPMLRGAVIMDYAALPLPVEAAERRALGILGIEVGVTLAVAGAVLGIFDTLYVPRKEGEGAPPREGEEAGR